MSQNMEKTVWNYWTFPYGIWLPKDDPKLIEKISKYIKIIVEPNGYTMMYFNGSRVRTPRESGSHPCYNCGHCIDNGFSSCGNKKCVKDRKERKLCDGQHWRGRGKTWIHDIDQDVFFKNEKKGIVYHWAPCKECRLNVKWLGEYQYDQHIEYYNQYLKGNQPLNHTTHSENKIIPTSRTIPGKLRHILFVKYNYKCNECGISKEETSLEIDHIIPWSKGGQTHIDNLQVLCKKCNRSKHARIWMDV